jgi:L-lactate dehydrogenase complex protein LldG
MADARDQILSDIRAALGSALLPDALPGHPTADNPRAKGGLERFTAELEELSGRVIRAGSAGEAAKIVAGLCEERGWRQALAWAWEEIGCRGLDEALRQAGVEIGHDGTPADVAGVPVGITGAEAALADTGTLVSRNGPGRSPLASLLPPVHIALLDARSIFPDMQSYFDSLSGEGGAARHVGESSTLVFIDGPSRTADIEQTLTLGVHGPRELTVVVWGQEQR